MCVNINSIITSIKAHPSLTLLRYKLNIYLLSGIISRSLYIEFRSGFKVFFGSFSRALLPFSISHYSHFPSTYMELPFLNLNQLTNTFIWPHQVQLWHVQDLHFVMLGLWLWHANSSCSMQDLVPRPGKEPRPPALGMQSLSHLTTKEAPAIFKFNTSFSSLVHVSSLKCYCP